MDSEANEERRDRTAMSRLSKKERQERTEKALAEIATWTPEHTVHAIAEFERMMKLICAIQSGVPVSNEVRADVTSFILDTGRCLGKKNLPLYLKRVEAKLFQPS